MADWDSPPPLPPTPFPSHWRYEAGLGYSVSPLDSARNPNLENTTAGKSRLPKHFFPRRRFSTVEACQAYEDECASGDHVTGVYARHHHYSRQGDGAGYGYRVLLRPGARGADNRHSRTFHMREYGNNLERALAAAVRCRRAVLADQGRTADAATSAAAAAAVADAGEGEDEYTVDNRPKGLLFESNRKHRRFRVQRPLTHVGAKRKYDDYYVQREFGGDEGEAFRVALEHWRHLRQQRETGSGRIFVPTNTQAPTAASAAQAWDDGSDGNNPWDQGSADAFSGDDQGSSVDSNGN